MNKLAAAKPGDVVSVDGLPVHMESVEECEKAEVHICCRTSEIAVTFTPSVKGNCARCGEEIWMAVDSPKKPQKICMQCAVKYLDEREVTE